MFALCSRSTTNYYQSKSTRLTISLFPTDLYSSTFTEIGTGDTDEVLLFFFFFFGIGMDEMDELEDEEDESGDSYRFLLIFFDLLPLFFCLLLRVLLFFFGLEDSDESEQSLQNFLRLREDASDFCAPVS